MADGLTIATQVDNQTATAVAVTDDCGAAGHAQVVKLAISTDGAATLIPADAANGIDVDVTRVQGTVTVDGSGVVQPVSGTVTANLAAGTNNIGDVDVLTVPAPLNVTGTGTEAAALRVTIATDSTGVLSVDDNGGSITVDAAAGGLIVGDGTNPVVVLTDGADNVANSNNQLVTAAMGYVYDGATWDRLPGNSTDGALVNLGANNDVTVTSISAGTNYVGKVRLTDGVTDGEVVPLAGYNAQAVAIVDGSGNQITSFGGGTQYTEDVAAAADPVGTVPIMVRADTPATVVSTNGDNIAQRATNYGAAYVQMVTSTGSFIDSVGGGTEYTEDVAAAADPLGKATILVRADTPGAITSTNGDNVAQRGTNYGAAYTQIVTSAGAFVDTFGGGTQYPEGTATATLTGTVALMEGAANTTVPLQGTAVDGLLVNLGTNNDVSVTSVITGTGATNLGKAEDAGHTTGDVGVMMLGVRNDANAALSGTDLDYTPVATTSAGQVLTIRQADLQKLTATTASLTTSVTAYTAGDQVGNLLTLSNAARISGGSGMVVGCTLISAADIIGAYDVVIFDSTVSLTADNSVFGFVDADALKIVGLIQLAGAYDLGSNRIAQNYNIAMPYVCSGGTALYAGLVTRSGHTFFGAQTDLQLNLYVERN